MGKLVAPRDIWYYLPVWMLITIPMLYIFLFIFANLSTIKTIVINKINLREDRFIQFDLFILVLFYFLFLGISFSGATFYHAWKHSYFIYGPFACIVISGLVKIWEISFTNKSLKFIKNSCIILICSYSFLSTGIWFFRNHPLDFVYFNEIGRNYASQFTRDYAGVGTKQCILYLANTLDDPVIRLGVNADNTYGSTEVTLYRLPERISSRFAPIWQTKYADYICFSYKNTLGNNYDYPNFSLMKTFSVDNYDVVSVYKRIREDD